MANHIWKNSFCCKKQCQMFKMMATQVGETPHTTVLPSLTPPNSPPGGNPQVDQVNPDNLFIMLGGAVDSGGESGRCQHKMETWEPSNLKSILMKKQLVIS